VPDVFAVSLQIALGIGLPAVVIRKDLLRLAPEKLARAWNDASLWSAVVAFGPISLIVHFARTRRTLWGLLLGLVWAALVMALSLIAELASSATV
jgi:hypothetical protein